MTIDPAQLSPWLWIVAPLIVIVAYTVFGLSGFGSTVISVPILAHFLPVAYLVPLMALLDMVSATMIGRANRKQLAARELKWLLPFMFVGFVVGVTLLAHVPDRYMRVALGLFVVAVGVHGIVNPVMSRRLSALWSLPAGVIGGIASTTFGAGGPIYATYLAGRLDDKGAIRSTLSTLISISAFCRVIAYAVGGLLLHLAFLVGGVALFPFVLLGLRLGNRIHVGLTQGQMRRVVGTVLVLTGSSLLVRTLL